jgi:Tfp pilus assembly protein PilN
MTEVKQKINLYLPRFQPERLSKEAKELFISVLATLVLLMLVVIAFLAINFFSTAGIADQEKSLSILNADLADAVSKIPNTTPDTNLVNRIAKEKLAVYRKQKVIDYLYKDTISEGENFTNLIDQLAQQDIKEIWLNKIEVLNKGDDIQLFGYAKRPSQVSKYIEMLGLQEAYKGRSFQQIKINNSTNNWNEFYISTLSLDELLLIEAVGVK